MTTLSAKLGSVAEQYSLGFLEFMQFTLPHEVVFASGHYNDYDHVITENVHGDPGGPTKYGLDTNSHPHLVIEDLTFESALAEYFSEIWTPLRGEQVHGNVGISLCDAAVNVSNSRAVKWMQAGAGFTGDDVDGIFGALTLAKVNSCDPRDITAAINDARDHYYTVEVRHSLRDHFLAGWENRLHDLETFETNLPNVTSQTAIA